MSNDFLGQILGSVLGRAGGGQQSTTGGGGLGDLLGGLMGGGAGSGSQGGIGGLGAGLGGVGSNGGAVGSGGGTSPFGGGKGAALTALMIPLAMQWVQRNGGISGVLQRFQQKGYTQQASSWVSTGPNDALPQQAIGDVVGNDELSKMSQQLGVSNEEVSGRMAQILPEVVNHMTPEGNVPHDADDILHRGLSSLQRLMHPA
jgi:uncharacterized protein YidB (DUF937 family)